MNDAKYIGLDVHQATISVAVLDSAGKLVMEAILETKAETILQFIHGLRGSLHVTLEEGTCAAWSHDLLKPHVAKVVACDGNASHLFHRLSVDGGNGGRGDMGVRAPKNMLQFRQTRISLRLPEGSYGKFRFARINAGLGSNAGTTGRHP